MQDSVQNYGSWQTVDEIVVPGQQEALIPYGMPQSQPAQPVPTYNPWRWMRDSIAKAKEDSVVRAANDSMARIPSGYGLILEAPYKKVDISAYTGHVDSGLGLSWIFAALGILFCAVCLKLKSAPGYLATLWSDMTEIRMRHNMFDNTVKETSFITILILGWICCVGVLLWQLLQSFGGVPLEGSPRHFADNPLLGVGLCSAAVGIYALFMFIAYEVTGHVFADSKVTGLWVKGASAGMALQTFLLFPLALVVLCYPEWDQELLIIGAIILLIGKIVFIYKGFRIFFQQIGSWLVFLCYLCSLELVPLLLTYFLAYRFCIEWL